MDSSSGVWVWKPEYLIHGRSKFACIILNTKIRQPEGVVVNLWENADLRCTIDGGTNRWKQFLIERNCKGELKPPDYITGDFDSITDDTRSCFDSKISKYVHTPDQNETDFTKSIDVLKPVLSERGINDVVVLHDTSGRFDQIMANINTLFKRQSPTCNIFLVGSNSITWLLRPGQHSIEVPRHLIDNKRWCALIPISEPVVCTTKGLFWNLNNQRLEFGHLVSTSNTYAEEIVEINTEKSLVWSMGYFSFEDE